MNTDTPDPAAPSEMLPCPHCGAPARYTASMGECWVDCADGCQNMRLDETAAVEHWNRRAPSPTPRAGDQAVADEIVKAVLALEYNTSKDRTLGGPGGLERRRDAARDAVARLLSARPAPDAGAELSHKDWCLLGRIFNECPYLTTDTYMRINDWLKEHIAAALRAATGER